MSPRNLAWALGPFSRAARLLTRRRRVRPAARRLGTEPLEPRAMLSTTATLGFDAAAFTRIPVTFRRPDGTVGSSTTAYVGQLSWSGMTGEAATVGVPASFTSFCIEGLQGVAPGRNTFATIGPASGSPLLGADRADLLADFWRQYGPTDAAGFADKTDSAAFQLGVWELINDGRPVRNAATNPLAAGQFSVGATGLTTQAAVRARQWLDGLDSAAPGRTAVALYALHSPTRQDQVVAVPIVDLDVDADNTGVVDRSAAEETAEKAGVTAATPQPTGPGLIVPVGGNRVQMVVDVPRGRTARLEFTADVATRARVWTNAGAEVLSGHTVATPIHGGDPSIFWIGAFAPSTNMADLVFTLTTSDGGPVSSDTIRGTAVAVDLDVDSNNDSGFLEPDDNPEEDQLENDLTTGKRIFATTGDYDDDGFTDSSDFDAVSGLHFVPMAVRLHPILGLLQPSLIEICFAYDSSLFRIWKPGIDAANTRSPSDILRTGAFLDVSQLGLSTNAYVVVMAEALKQSSSAAPIVVQVQARGSTWSLTMNDKVHLLAYDPIDADVDSDNNDKLGVPSGTPAEDDVEAPADPDKPGKIILANTLDSTGNGIPDFADGYHTLSPFGSQDFADLVLRIDPKLDVTRAKLKIEYAASDPELVRKTPSSAPRDDSTYELPSNGKLRIWTKDGKRWRSGKSIRLGGDFVEPQEYELRHLFECRSEVTLYVEGIREGVEKIKVSIDVDGDGRYDARDIVRISIAELTLVYTDISGYREIGQSTLSSIPRIPSDVEPDGIAADWQPGVGDGSLMFVRLVGSELLDKLPDGFGESHITFGHWDTTYHFFQELPPDGDWPTQVDGAFHRLTDRWVNGIQPRLQENGIRIPGDVYASGKKVYAGAVYRAPIEFNLARLDDGRRTRDFRPMVKIDSQFDSRAGKPQALVIVRPPVVLVHGINSNPETWSQIVPSMQAQGFEVEHFRVNHGGDAAHGNGAVEVSSQLVGQMVDKAIESFHGGKFIGPDGNAYQAFPSLFAPSEITKTLFPTSSSPASKGRKIIAQKADIIAHSYGGILSRWYIEHSGTYESKRNVRKLVTLGTPHLGSPQANMVREVFKNGLIAHAKAHGVVPLEPKMLTLVDGLQSGWVGNLPIGVKAFTSTDGVAANGNYLPAFDTLPVNSLALRKLAAGRGDSGPFADDVGYAAIVGTQSGGALLDLNHAFIPLYDNVGFNDTPYFPWLKTYEGTNDSVVPEWSAQLGIEDYNFAVNVDHGTLPKSMDAVGKAIQWLNGRSDKGGFRQVPRGSEQRSTYRNSPPDWAQNAYHEHGNGLNQDAIIKVVLDPANEYRDAWYGTRPPAWSADPDDEMLGIRRVRVTGMVEQASAASMIISILNAEATTDTRLDQTTAVVTSGVGHGLVRFSAELKIGRAQDGVSGPLGYANNFSDTYKLYARVVDRAGNNVPGFSASGAYAIKASPSTAIVIPAVSELPAPAKDPADGLILTAKGAFEIEAGGESPNSDIIRLYADDYGFFNTLVHEESVSIPAGLGGWDKLLVGYETTITLSRDTDGTVRGNKASSGSAAPLIFQYLTGSKLSSGNTQVP